MDEPFFYNRFFKRVFRADFSFFQRFQNGVVQRLHAKFFAGLNRRRNLKSFPLSNQVGHGGSHDQNFQDRHPGFFIGGIPKNFGKGYKLGSGEVFVSEGDEYDSAFFDKGSKFLHYLPDMVILNNVEFDHIDIFKDYSEVALTFSRLINLIPRSGYLVACWRPGVPAVTSDPHPAATETPCRRRCR